MTWSKNPDHSEVLALSEAQDLTSVAPLPEGQVSTLPLVHCCRGSPHDSHTLGRRWRGMETVPR